MHADDELDAVYEALVHWADVMMVSTPIRWGQASSLYFKMAERLNCIQNQVTTHNRVMIRNKVAAFIIVGGQDNVQGVAGQMLGFFAELGFHFPQFPFIAHSRGWSAEDMEQNVARCGRSVTLHDGAAELGAARGRACQRDCCETRTGRETERGGRKAHADRDGLTGAKPTSFAPRLLQPQSCLLASFAPSARLSNFAHITCGCTR